MQKFSIHDEDKVKILLTENGIKNFRYAQIENAIYKNFITDFDAIETIPKDVRQLLKEHCYFQSLVIDTLKTSADGQTTKILFKTSTGEFIESVIMRHLT
jgi:23S rRNA (adenine2503-C2)-methyltransferase